MKTKLLNLSNKNYIKNLEIKRYLFNEEKTVNLKKDAYRSNGLGLFICKSIIEIHGGTIEAFNNDIGGATFKFYIELSKPTAN